MRISRSPSLVVLAATWLLVANGCGKEKVEECNALILVINGGVDALEQGAKNTADPTGIKELREMATVMEKVADDAAAVSLTVAELQKYSQDYQTMARTVAGSARELADAAEAKDATRMTEAQKAMDEAVKAEDPLVDNINKFCQTQ